LRRRTFGIAIGLPKPTVVKLQDLAGAGNLHTDSLPQLFPATESTAIPDPGEEARVQAGARLR
jgi:hypothetical protein